MSTSTLTRNSGSATPCGCGGGSAGTATAHPCSCGGACGGGCQTHGYVRPRFFAGQLLTEDDLQALSEYVGEKSRLHNRHFMGDGVVCGLQVTCSPCGDGSIVVHPGHALDCCGNDLVLECAVELDVIAMIRDLRRNLRDGQDCGDPCADSKPGVKVDPNRRVTSARTPVPRQYCLYVRYSEETSDPVAPYSTDEPCGSSGCEPTRVREGVKFEVRCRTEMPPPDTLLRRVLQCLGDPTNVRALVRNLSRLLNKAGTPEGFKETKQALLAWLDSMGQLTDCRLRAKVEAIPVPTDQVEEEDYIGLVYVFYEVLRDCICRAILPPCAPCDDTGVLLACLEFDDCKVVKICNLERKFVLTGPNIRYWLPVDILGDEFERFCCSEFPAPKPTTPAGTSEEAERTAGIAAADESERADAGGRTPEPAPRVGRRTFPARVRDGLGLSERDGALLGETGFELLSMLASGELNDLRLAQRLHGAATGRSLDTRLSDRVVRSDSFKRAVTNIERQQDARVEAKVEAARQQLQAENAKVVEEMATMRRSLSDRLDELKGQIGQTPRPVAGENSDEPPKKPRK